MKTLCQMNVILNLCFSIDFCRFYFLGFYFGYRTFSRMSCSRVYVPELTYSRRYLFPNIKFHEDTYFFDFAISDSPSS